MSKMSSLVEGRIFKIVLAVDIGAVDKQQLNGALVSSIYGIMKRRVSPLQMQHNLQQG
eukprot:m.190918 g.190918  ORF g.190918 m.190918 type:complete len:58 (+) comp10589_c0_seq2:149-322(+)